MAQYTGQLVLGVLEQRATILEKHHSSTWVFAVVMLMSTRAMNVCERAQFTLEAVGVLANSLE